MFFVFCLQGSKDSAGTEGESSSEEDAETTEVYPLSESTDQKNAAATKETEAGAEISALVNYIQPVHFTNFENAESESKLLFLWDCYNSCSRS